MRGPWGQAPDILFLTHEATRTGAPLSLLHFLRWLRANTALAVSVVAIEGGALVEDFRAVAPTTVLSDLRETGISRRLRGSGLGAVDSMGRSAVARARLLALQDAPVVYVNSLGAAAGLRLLGHRDRLVITHVHELDQGFRVAERAGTLQSALSGTDWFIAASKAVETLLCRDHGVAPERCRLAYPFIDVGAIDDHVATAEPAARTRARLGIPAEAQVVGASGWPQWRKGTDLFVALAVAMLDRPREVPLHFVWVGAPEGLDETAMLRHDVARAGIADRLHIVGVLERPAEVYRLFDVFALTSREDPFPLVGLEAALLAIPLVCFPQTGMTELLGAEHPGIVPYANIAAMATVIDALLADPEGRARLGRRAGGLVREGFDVGHGAPALASMVQGWRDERATVGP